MTTPRRVAPAALLACALAAAPALAVSGAGLSDAGRTIELIQDQARTAQSAALTDADATIVDPQLAFSDPIRFMDENEPWAIAQAYGLPPQRVKLSRRTDAPVKIDVSLSRQTLTVHSAQGDATYPISSGRPGHATPAGGCYDPDFLDPFHRSSLYDGAPMPHAIFFNGNIAVHATYDEAHLGHPASHGCVRLSQANAATLYALVKKAGIANTLVCVSK
jgi:lipoprotein-anchoring transpeptidase ErfK/SrfK